MHHHWRAPLTTRYLEIKDPQDVVMTPTVYGFAWNLEQDPELITWKGRRLLTEAEAVFYDDLANRTLLELAPPGAELVYVGKKKAVHAHTQEEISGMLIDRARQGKTVVRLKGGDPFVFGRGAEEILHLTEEGIPWEIVPGVTSATAILITSSMVGMGSAIGLPPSSTAPTLPPPDASHHGDEKVYQRRPSGPLWTSSSGGSTRSSTGSSRPRPRGGG